MESPNEQYTAEKQEVEEDRHENSVMLKPMTVRTTTSTYFVGFSVFNHAFLQTGSLCTDRPSPQKKNRRGTVCDLPLIIVFHTTWFFLECVENDLIGYYPSIITSLKQRVLIGFYFYFSTSTPWEPPWEILRWVRSCVLWARYKIRIKIFLIVKEIFLLKYERNCYLWIVKWKSIRRTFVGIVSAKETKALFTRWI